ncbi:MAG: hypothetical protein L6V93_10720 [Clostridiales bacterium]|nr:MAG: hypothetical protein L6V93_10720 [Clostridiales bacterium]
MSESDGASLLARYTILSLVITVLNDVNQRSTVMSINDAEIPYKIDSAVSGFPLGRYVKIVTPSWLKNGRYKRCRYKKYRRVNNAFSPLVFRLQNALKIPLTKSTAQCITVA